MRLVSFIADRGEAVDLCGGHWQGGRKCGFLSLGVENAGSEPLNSLPFPRINFRFDRGVWNRKNLLQCLLERSVFVRRILAGRFRATRC